MQRRPKDCWVGAVSRDAQVLIDGDRRNLIVAYQACKDRQASCVGGRPAFRAQGIRVQVPHSSTTSFPTTVALWISSKHFVQLTGTAIDDDDMAVATAQSPAFYRHLRWNGIWPGIAFACIVELYRHELLFVRHHDVGDAD